MAATGSSAAAEAAARCEPSAGPGVPRASNQRGRAGESRHNPSVTSAQRSTVRLLRNASTAGAIAPGRSSPSTAVAMMASQRSLKPIDNADLPRANRRSRRRGCALHPGDRDRLSRPQRGELVAEQVEVADAVEFLVVRDAGRAVAEPDLGADVDVHLGAAVGGVAAKRLALAPLIDRKRPGHFAPDRLCHRDRRLGYIAPEHERADKRARTHYCRCHDGDFFHHPTGFNPVPLIARHTAAKFPTAAKCITKTRAPPWRRCGPRLN